MASVIEIVDSDDDGLTMDLNQQLLRQIIIKTDPANLEQIPIESNEVPSDEIPSTSAAMTTEHDITTTEEISGNKGTKERVRHRRKSVHQTMRASPDIQFETIALDDDDDDDKGCGTNRRTIIRLQPRSKPSKLKSTPKVPILQPQRGTIPIPIQDQMNNAFQAFINDDETKATIRRIAMERVRVNTLLALYGMPDVNFTMFENAEQLQFQLEERIKRRKLGNRQAASFKNVSSGCSLLLNNKNIPVKKD